MLLKQAVKVLILAGLASVASTLALSKSAQAECYFFNLICREEGTSEEVVGERDVTLSDRDRLAPRRVPPLGTTRRSHTTDSYQITRIQLTTHAHLPWVDTGIDLSPGETLSIEATGTWSVGGVNSQQTGSSGYPGAYNPQALDSRLPFAALIGAVGNSNPFLVGDGRSDTIVTGGRLYLSMNDVAESFDDNSGAMRVEILIKQPL